jgi:hypothetical protein
MKTMTLIAILFTTLLPNVTWANEVDGTSDGRCIDQTDQVFKKIKFLRPDLADRHVTLIAKYLAQSITQNYLNVNIVLSIFFLESRFEQGAVGPYNEIGIAQIMPYWKYSKTCAGLKLWHVQGNVECGCRILKLYTDYFKPGEEMYGVLAYNMGPTTAQWVYSKGISLKRIPYTREVYRILDRLK